MSKEKSLDRYHGNAAEPEDIAHSGGHWAFRERGGQTTAARWKPSKRQATKPKRKPKGKSR